ncbi:NACHT, LRR and PYD domains-containing protein 3-like [Dysidea avara]|uniref:NACHT, LRR and PYD domains-containing protein 3-like n=1 Tax=Dysidea avara TaxID=196820 RepID=UPI003324E26B
MAEGNHDLACHDHSETILVQDAAVIDEIKNKDDTPTMRDLNRYVTNIYAADWKDIGIELGLELHTLRIIAKDYPQQAVDCFQDVLYHWLKSTHNPTWKILEVAITNVNRQNHGLGPVDKVDEAISYKGLDSVSQSTADISEQVVDMLCKDYTEKRDRNEEDEWPPKQPRTIVNVALVHYRGRRTQQELIEITSRYKDGTTTADMLASSQSKLIKNSHSYTRVTKNINEIFAAYHNDLEDSGTNYEVDKTPKYILIEGAPGIGKTVLAKEISYLWAKGELLENVSILILLFLRDPVLKEIESEAQLAQYITRYMCDDLKLKHKQTELIACLKELRICVILDGYDEYPELLRKKSFIADLIKGKIFPNSIVVVTSRPTATMHLHDMVDRRIEILGFAQEEREKYIMESLKEMPDKQEQLKVYLKCHPIINSLVYVPLHLAVLLYLFKEHNILFETLTEMNESFILHTIYRNMAKHDLVPSGVNTEIKTLKNLPTDPNVYGVVCNLSKLAFVGLKNNQLVFTYNEIKTHISQIDSIPGVLNGFGLLQAVQHFSPGGGAGKTASFNFLHFTMQEYLAAFYVSIYLSEKQKISLVGETFWEGKYNFMWMMYAGINGVSSKVFDKFLCKLKGDMLTFSRDIKSNKIKCLHMVQCFIEAKSKLVLKEISCLFQNGEISFHGISKLHPHNISSLLSYISKYDVQVLSINLRDCHIGDIGMGILQQYFSTYPEKASNIKSVDLFGNDSVLLWNVYLSIFKPKHLRKLDWSSLRGVDIDEIVTVLHNNNTIESLDISGNAFNDNAAKKIAKGLLHNTTLKELDISNNDIFTDGAIAISESLKHNTTLQYITISWNKGRD